MILRPMTMSDADFMLELKNDEATRRFAIATNDFIKKEDHYKWLESNIQYFQIIEFDGLRSGAIRIQDNEISIWIDKEIRGKGAARLVLQRKAAYGMVAKIVEGNIASMRAFIAAGFSPLKKIDNYYIFQK